MKTHIRDYIDTLHPGTVQSFENMTLFPITRDGPGGPVYLTFSEALAQEYIAVTEIDKGGSVPNLLVQSKAALPVLILDGEELRGAKQNRVLNTTVLIPPREKVVIPVSCTEQGRWNYVSSEFQDSDTVMHVKARAAKSASVSFSLRESKSFASNQSEVWDNIEELHDELGSQSATGAMSEAFESRKQSLEEFLEAFPAIEEQSGLLVAVEGKIVGLDVLSRPEAYARLHEKLVRSYAMEAIIRKRRRRRNTSKGEAVSAEKAQAFLRDLSGCREEVHDSVGLGSDCRYTGKNVAGAVLDFEKTAIHMAFFRTSGKSDRSEVLNWGHRRAGNR